MRRRKVPGRLGSPGDRSRCNTDGEPARAEADDGRVTSRSAKADFLKRLPRLRPLALPSRAARST